MNPFNNSGKRARIAGSVLLLVIFIAGALAGAASERVMRADETPATPKSGAEVRGGSRRLLYDEQFATALELTADQRTQIKAIMERRDLEAKKAWNEAEPRLRAIGDATRAEIQTVLSPEQVVKLEAEIARRRATWKDRHKCSAGDSLKTEKKI